MAKYSNTIEYNLRTSLDKSGITELQRELAKVTITLQDFNAKGIISDDAFKGAIKKVKEFQNLLSSSYSNKMGMLDFNKFTSQMQKSKTTLKDFSNAFSMAGTQGDATFMKAISRLGKLDTGLKTTSSTVDKVFNTIGNTVRWGIVAGAFERVRNEISRSVEYVKELDRSLTDIRIVTDYNSQQMREFSLQANEAARSLSSTTVDYTDASLIFAQQGFNLEDSQRLADLTIKVANTTQQSTAETSEQITSWMNGYKMSLEELEATLDKVTKVAAFGASDTEELMTAASKVASVASTLGVTEDQLISQMSTIISVTREAPEAVGNSLKTLYARLEDLELGESLEDGVNLGEVSSTLEKVGVSVVDTNGELRNMGDIIEDLMAKWGDFSRAEQQAIAEKLAGKYQYNRFITLMENQEMYDATMEASLGSEGFLDRTQEIYADSVQGKMNQLQATWESLVTELFDGREIKPFLDGLMDAIDLTRDLVESLGGLGPVLSGLAVTASRLFSGQIAEHAQNLISNLNVNQTQKANAKAREAASKAGIFENLTEDQGFQDIYGFMEKGFYNEGNMNSSQKEAYNENMEGWVNTATQRYALEEQYRSTISNMRLAFDFLGNDPDEFIKQKTNGALTTLDEMNNMWRFSEAMGETYGDAKQLIEENDGILQDFQRLKEDTSSVSHDMSDMFNDFQNMDIKNANSEDFADFYQRLGDVRPKIEELKDDFENSAEIQVFADRILKVADALKELPMDGDHSEEIQKWKKEFETAAKESIKIAQRADEGLKAFTNANDATSLAVKIQALRQDEEGFKTKAVEQFKNIDLSTVINSVTTLASGLGQVAFGISSLQNLGSIWDSDDLTFLEKMNQTFLNVSVSLGSIISGVQGFTSGFGKLAGVLSSYSAGLLQMTNVNGGAIKSFGELVKSAGGLTGALKVLKVGIEGIGKSLLTLLKNPVVLAIAAIAALVAGIVWAFNAVKEEMTKTTREAAKAKEVAAEAQGALQAAETDYNNLMSSVQSYHDSQEAIGALTEGTKEWRNAIYDANQQVLELLRNYPELAGYMSKGEGGRLIIDEEGFEAIQQKELGRVSRANLTAVTTDNKANELAVKAQLEDFKNEVNQHQVPTTTEVVKKPSANNILLNAPDPNLGFMNRSKQPKVEYTYEVKEGSNPINDEDLKVLAKAMRYDEDGTLTIEEIANALQRDVADPIVQAIAEQNADGKIDALLNAANTTEEQTRLQLEGAMQNVLLATPDYDSESPLNDKVVELATTRFDLRYRQLTGELGTLDQESLAKQYAEAEGLDFKEINGERAMFLNSAGETVEFSRDTMIKAVAANKAAAEIIDTLGGLIDLAEKIRSSELGTEYSGIAESAAGGYVDEQGIARFDYDNLGSDELDYLANGKIKAEDGQLRDMTLDDFGLTEEDVKRLGFSSGQQFMEEFIKGARQEGKKDDNTSDAVFLDNDELNGKLKAQEIEREDFDNFRNDFTTNVGAKELAKEIEDSTEKIGKLKESMADAQTEAERSNIAEEIAKEEKHLDDLNRALDETVYNSYETAEGLRELGEFLNDDTVALLKGDDSVVGFSDALDNLRGIMGQVLNTDASGLSQDFLTNAENIELMKQAANGSVEALQQLRAAVVQDLIFNVYTNIDTSQLDANLLNEYIAGIQGQLSDLEVGAAINDTTFIVGLATMMENAGATATQITKMLEGLGIEIDEETLPIKYPNITQKQLEGGTSEDPTAETVIGATVSGETTIDWPKVTYRVKNKGETANTNLLRPAPSRINTGDDKPKSSPKSSTPKSSSGKSYEAKNKERIKEEIDRYERVNAILQGVGNDLEKINQEENRLTGFKLADNIKEQNKLLTRQIELYKEKLEIQKQEAQELKDQLSSQYGITFDGEGYIQNYAAIHRQLEGEVNSLIDRYNSTTTEAGQEALEKQIDAAQKKLDDFKEAYNRYDELFAGEMRETINTIEDLRNTIEDLNISLFEKAVEAADTIKDIQEAYIDFMAVFSGRQSDDPFRAMETGAQKLGKYFDVATQDVNKFYDTWIERTKQLQREAQTAEQKAFYAAQVQSIQKAKNSLGKGTMEANGTGYLDMAMGNLSAILKQIDEYERTGFSSIFGENQSALYETAKDVFDQATSMIMDFEGAIDDLRDSILDAIDDIGDRLDKRIESYERLNDELEHLLDINEMLNGDRSYDNMNTILAQQNQIYQNQIKHQQEAIKLWEDMQASMVKGSDEWEAVQEKIIEAQQNINELVVSSLQILTSQYENTVNKVLDTWTSSPFGNDLDWIAEEWELINRNADYYLDATNKAYNIQKLQGKYLELLDGSNDLHIQQKITQQMEEQLGYLRDKTNLSEYDVQYANMQLEILQKTIALEEARNNKNQMKLKRDAQGNYNYVYTANQDDVAAAEADLLDSQNNAYNLSKEQMKQTQADSLSALQDARNLLDGIWKDANLSLEEKKKRTETIINSLREYLEGTSEQLSTSEKNIINDFIGMVEMMTDENAANLQEVYDQIIAGNVDAFDQIDTRWSTSITNWLQNLDSFNTSTNGMFENLVGNAENFQQNVNQIGSMVGQDFDNLAGEVQKVVDKTTELNKTTAEFFDQLRNDSGIVKEHEKTLQSYADKITSVTNEMKTYQAQVAQLQNKLTATEQQNAALTSQVQQLQNPNSGSGSGSSGGGSKGIDARAGDIVGYKGQYFYDSQGKRPLGSLYSGKANAVRISSFSGAPYGNGKTYGNYKVHLEQPGGGWLGWVQPSQLFDTGGYTGTWSGSGNQETKDGRLAWLHQKELVLNASDTENILAAVKVVREFADSFKNALSSSMASIGGFGGQPTGNSMGVDQNVHITAEFPNVSSTKEIEDALLSLNDRAIQYAFKAV